MSLFFRVCIYELTNRSPSKESVALIGIGLGALSLLSPYMYGPVIAGSIVGVCTDKQQASKLGYASLMGAICLALSGLWYEGYLSSSEKAATAYAQGIANNRDMCLLPGRQDQFRMSSHNTTLTITVGDANPILDRASMNTIVYPPRQGRSVPVAIGTTYPSPEDLPDFALNEQNRFKIYSVPLTVSYPLSNFFWKGYSEVTTTVTVRRGWAIQAEMARFSCLRQTGRIDPNSAAGPS
jgi:hypothetical protein